MIHRASGTPGVLTEDKTKRPASIRSKMYIRTDLRPRGDCSRSCSSRSNSGGFVSHAEEGLGSPIPGVSFRTERRIFGGCNSVRRLSRDLRRVLFVYDSLLGDNNPFWLIIKPLFVHSPASSMLISHPGLRFACFEQKLHSSLQPDWSS
jgi:hypothetical protein